MRSRSRVAFGRVAVAVGWALLIPAAAADGTISHEAPVDAEAGAALAATCSGCHAAGSPVLPDLRTRSRASIETALLAFRSGDREGTLMNRLARGYSKPEIAAIAAALGQR